MGGQIVPLRPTYTAQQYRVDLLGGTQCLCRQWLAGSIDCGATNKAFTHVQCAARLSGGHLHNFCRGGDNFLADAITGQQ